MSDNVKTVEQFLETARLETGDVWMDNHDWKHLIEMVEQLTQERDAAIAETETFREVLVDNEAYGLQVIRERDAAKADAQRLAEIVQRYRIMGDWFRAAAAIHKDAAAALYEHQRGEE